MKKACLSFGAVLIAICALLALQPPTRVQAVPEAACSGADGGERVFRPNDGRVSWKRSNDFIRATAKENRLAGEARPTTGRDAASILLSISMLGVGLLTVNGLLRRLLKQAGRTPDKRMRRAKAWILAALAIAAGSTWAMRGSAGSPAKAAVRSVASPAAAAATAAAATAAAATAAAERFSSALQFGGNGATQIGSADYDAQGNLYVTGGFTGTVTFNTNPQVTFTSTQDFDVFVAKFAPGGQCLWARIANGPNDLESGFSLDGAITAAVDAQGNVYIGGGFVGELSFKDASGGTAATLGDVNEDVNFEPFVAKYDAAGTLLWAVGGMSGAADDPELATDLDAGINGVVDLALDATGNPYVCGVAAGLNFLGAEINVTSESDAILSRLDPATGNPVWTVAIASSEYADAAALDVDGAGNIYLVGGSEGDVTFPTDPPTEFIVDGDFLDTFVAKFTPAGECLWARQFGSLENGVGFDLAVNPDGEIYLAGAFEEEMEFDGLTLADNGAEVAGFLVKLSPDGDAIWGRTFGQPEFTNAQRVGLDASGNPYVTGLVAGQAIFGAEAGSGQTLESLGENDQFLLKYDANGVFQFVKPLFAIGTGSDELFNDETVPIHVVTMQVVSNPATGTMQVLGDFNNLLTLDALTLTTSGVNRHAFVASLCPTITLPAAILPAASAGTAYQQSLAASPSGGYTYAVTQGGLPGGLALNSATGLLSGTPNFPGTAAFTMTATNASGCTGTQQFTLTIGCPAITLATLTSGAIGTSYSQNLAAAPIGGNYSYQLSSGSLPPGLSLNAATGVIRGTPSTPGNFNFIARATGWGGCIGERSYAVTIGGGGCASVNLPASVPNGNTGAFYSASVAASPAGNYSYAVTAGSLPPGVTLYGQIGLLFGYPAGAGAYNLTVTATGTNGCSLHRSYTLTVGAAFRAEQRQLRR